MKAPVLSIVVPCYNEQDVFSLCLNELSSRINEMKDKGNEVAEWFHCLTTLSQTLTFGLLPPKSALFIFPLLLGFGCVIHD